MLQSSLAESDTESHAAADLWLHFSYLLTEYHTHAPEWVLLFIYCLFTATYGGLQLLFNGVEELQLQLKKKKKKKIGLSTKYS